MLRASRNNGFVAATFILFICVAKTAPIARAITQSTECLLSEWQTILVFYSVNYLTHIGTVRSVPGAQKLDSILYMILSFLMPYYGVGRGLEAILRHAVSQHSMFTKRADSELQMALQAGALCIVVRGSDWNPLPDDASQIVIQNVRHIERNPWPTDEEETHPETHEMLHLRASLEQQARPRYLSRLLCISED